MFSGFTPQADSSVSRGEVAVGPLAQVQSLAR